MELLKQQHAIVAQGQGVTISVSSLSIWPELQRSSVAVREIASALNEKTAIPMVRAELELMTGNA